MDDTVTMTLARPIQAHNESVTQLVLRPPTVKELRVCGAPYRNADGGVTPDFNATAKLISMICQIPPSSVDQMAVGDFNEASLTLLGFTWGSPAPAAEVPAAPAAADPTAMISPGS